MLKFIKHHLDTIAGVGIYPVISFVLFFGFFIVMLLWLRKVSKTHVAHMSDLPLADLRAAQVNIDHALEPKP